MILASDGMGAEPLILQKYQFRRSKLHLLGIISFSPHLEHRVDSNLSEYIQQRLESLSANTHSTDSVTHFLRMYARECRLPVCSVRQRLVRHTGYTQQTMLAVHSIVQSFQTIFASSCHNDTAICEDLLDHFRLYPLLMQNLQTAEFTTDTGTVFTFDQNGDAIYSQHLYDINIITLEIAAHESVPTFSYKQVGVLSVLSLAWMSLLAFRSQSESYY